MAKGRNREKKNNLRGRTSSRVKRLIHRRREKAEEDRDNNHNEDLFYQKHGRKELSNA